MVKKLKIEDCSCHKHTIEIKIFTKNDDCDFNQDIVNESVDKLVDFLCSETSSGFVDELCKRLWQKHIELCGCEYSANR